MGPFLSPLETLPQLEELQCIPSEKVSHALSSILPRIQHPHPQLSQCMLELIQIHPHETIPHLPDILASDATTIHNAVETLSELLSSDRTLLVPILGTLASLPLSVSHRHQIRFTQQYALSVVDEKDLPAVVRSLIRTAGRRGVWTATALREGLSRPLSTNILPVLSVALRDLANPKHPVTKYLLAHPRLDWLNMHVYAAILARPSAGRSQFLSVRRAVTTAMRHYVLKPNTAQAFQGLPTAARRLLQILVSCCELSAFGISALTQFVIAVLQICPDATNSVAGDLARGDVASQFVLHALVKTGVAKKLGSPSPHVAVAVAVKTENWNPLFVKIRKSLLFGNQQERNKALSTAEHIMETATDQAVQDAISVMQASVPFSLADSVAIGFLRILASAIMRGFKEVKDMLQTRILSQCPPGFLKFEDQMSSNNSTLQIDVGLFWDQSLSAISTIVSAAAALKLCTKSAASRENISASVLDTSVLVPVVCVTLYQAVGRQSIDRPRFDVGTNEPDALTDIATHDLSIAISAFGASMAALVGIINVSSKCMGNFKPILERQATTFHIKISMNLLERLLEFDRMLTAMQLANNLLQKRRAQGNANCSSDKTKTNQIAALQASLDMADSVRNSVLTALMDPSRSRKAQSEKGSDFPFMSLQSIVSSLISVPDEPNDCSINDETTSQSPRDTELVRIDMLLTQQLFRLLRGEIRSEVTRAVTRPDVKAVSHDFMGFVEFLNSIGAEHGIDRRRFQDVFPDIDSKLACKDDIFMSDSSRKNIEEEKFRERPNRFAVQCAPCKYACTENESPYLRLAIDALSDRSEQKENDLNVENVIHSPPFTALLLDRAATYVVQAREIRKSATCDKNTLSDVVALSGLLLGCVNEILCFVSQRMSCKTSRTGVQKPSRHEKRSAFTNFLQKSGGFLRHRYSNACHLPDNLLETGNDLSEEVQNVLICLCWIIQNSVDAIVASKAVESILILSEYGVISKTAARRTAFQSLVTVYEYDAGTLWKGEAFVPVTQDSFTSWSLRRRRDDTDKISEFHLDPEPWIDLTAKHGRGNSSLEQQRILQYFTGMNIPRAVDESCGWVRELSRTLRGSPKISSEELHKEPRYRKKNNNDNNNDNNGNSQQEIDNASRKEFELCDILLDMLGFQAVIETLMQIAIVCLRSFQISESLTTERVSSEGDNPISVISASLRLCSGLLNLHHRNRVALFTAKTNDLSAQNLIIDFEFDNSIVNSCITILHLIRNRIEELLYWYCNSSVDVSRLPDETVALIRTIVGSTARIVKQCSTFSESIRKEYLMLLETNGKSENAKRKHSRTESPGYLRTRCRHSSHARQDDLTKAYKHVPKLVSCCENVVQSVKKLAKAIGIRANRVLANFAALPIEDDSCFHFGVGLKSKRTGLEYAEEGTNEKPLSAIRGNEEELIADDPNGKIHSRYSAEHSGSPEHDLELGSSPNRKDQEGLVEPETIKINIGGGRSRLTLGSP